MTTQHKGPVTLLKESFARLEAECKEQKEQHLRAAADFENYRRRVERDAELQQRLALERLVIDLLPVMDDFDRALAAASKDSSRDSLLKGLEMIHRQFREALCRHGLEEYSCVGTEFDPRRAEAIGFASAPDQPADTVISEACKGYSCKGRVLRPARVLVNRPGQAQPEAGE